MANWQTMTTRQKRVWKQTEKIATKIIESEIQEMIKRVMKSADHVAELESMGEKDHVAFREQMIDRLTQRAEKELLEAIDNVNPCEI